MTIIEQIVVGLFIVSVIPLCRWAYRIGYGDAPKNVCEPFHVLSNGERPPSKPTNYMQTSYRIGQREDLSDYIISNYTTRAVVTMKREIESSYSSNQ